MDSTSQVAPHNAQLEKIERLIVDRLEFLEKSLRSEIYDASERNHDRIRDLQGLTESRLDDLERALGRLSDRPIQMTGDLENMETFFSDSTDAMAEMHEAIDEMKGTLKELVKAVAQLR